MNRLTKRILALLLSAGLAGGLLAGCAEASSGSQSTLEETVQTTEETTASEETTESASNTRLFVDDAGREVLLPARIERIAPTGPVAQVILYSIAPDRMVGTARPFPGSAEGFFEQRYLDIPVFGQFYGKNADLNMEAVIDAGTQVIIDLGQAKETIAEDMDALQEQIGIPTVFIEAYTDRLPETYDRLGELLGMEDEAAVRSRYIRTALDMSGEAKAQMTEADQISVFIAMGDNGLDTNPRGSFHAEVLDIAGVVNIADIEAPSTGGSAVVSFEQLLEWDPDVIIVDETLDMAALLADPMWQTLDAVTEGRVYKVPSVPYNFLFNPPAVNRILGIYWLGQTLYPDFYDIDLEAAVKEFYQLFYHVDLTEEQLATVLAQPAVRP